MKTFARVAMLIAACLCAAAASAAAPGRHSLLDRATDLGPVNGASPIEITVWMKLRDQQGLDALTASQQAGNGSYLTMDQLRAQHAPSAADAARVAAFLKAQGFKVSPTQDTLYVKATATAGRVESVFKVDLHQYQLGSGRTFRSSNTKATLPAEIQPLVAAVGGLSTLGAEPQIARAVRTGATSTHTAAEAEGLAPQGVPFNAQSNGLYFAAQCFYGTTSESFSGNGVTATYQGNRYGAPITNGPPNLAPCGYQPSDLQTAYNLTPLYQRGLDGTGTTIAIVDAYGSTTIQNDAAVFSAAMGSAADQPDRHRYADRIQLLDGCQRRMGGGDDARCRVGARGRARRKDHPRGCTHELRLKTCSRGSSRRHRNRVWSPSPTAGAALTRRSLGSPPSLRSTPRRRYPAGDRCRRHLDDFSTGDYGDNAGLLALDYGWVGTSTGWPGSSPFATGVGGVSVALDSHKHIAWQTSWGTQLTEIVDTIALGSPPLDVAPDPTTRASMPAARAATAMPIRSRSGSSVFPGNRRGTPDISWVADPFTGVEIIYTADAAGDLNISVIGGTSVACPMFTALWGIATSGPTTCSDRRRHASIACRPGPERSPTSLTSARRTTSPARSPTRAARTRCGRVSWRRR